MSDPVSQMMTLLCNVVHTMPVGCAGRKPHPSDGGAVWGHQSLGNPPSGQRDGLAFSEMGMFVW